VQSLTQLARRYYELFNARDLTAAEELVHPGAVFRYPHSREHLVGRTGYRHLVRRWLQAFPDAVATVERLTLLGDDVAEVHIMGRGTHQGALAFGGLLNLPATGLASTLPFRDVLQFRDGQVTESTFRFDITELLQRLLPGTERRPKDVLVVDDERMSREVVVAQLASASHHVQACETFEAARNLLVSRPFDAVVTDLRLGAFNGLHLVALAQDSNPAARVIVYTGFDDPVLRKEAARLGASYLVKPVEAQHLHALLDAQP
jgi:CheY-like chemotaxis protein/ketosteroid isomerase-like protein